LPDRADLVAALPRRRLETGNSWSSDLGLGPDDSFVGQQR